MADLVPLEDVGSENKERATGCRQAPLSYVSAGAAHRTLSLDTAVDLFEAHTYQTDRPANAILAGCAEAAALLKPHPDLPATEITLA